MAWNEPGGGNRDPWGGNNRDQGPPDLDEVLRKLSAKLGGLLGGKTAGGAGAGLPPLRRSKGLWLIVGVVLVGWIFSGIYIVDEGKRGVVLRFGRYIDTTAPGPHWRLPWPIERHEIVDVEQRRVMEIGYRSAGRQGSRSVPKEALMLTQDENIVNIQISVQYQIKDPRAFLFNVVDPEATLQQVIESAVRETVGKSAMDFVLTEGRSDVVADVKLLAQQILDQYNTGLQLTNVNLQDAQPPEEVQDAFADAIKAREDEQRQKNEAEAYANDILPKARGQAARRLEEAVAYKEQAIAKAEGEAARFSQLVAEYQKAPEVTRQRLYLETMESVLSNSSKVLMDVQGGNSLFYLPLDKLVQGSSRSGAIGDQRGFEALPASPTEPADSVGGSRMRERDTSRIRESR
ncbi:MAG TPA: FtsH protease activity modulator HflK [Candidatus Competibacteraceae bacterium]|nr:FtsH protease activity modulator HflK [Candidatus Competibacteraceae bacterium]